MRDAIPMPRRFKGAGPTLAQIDAVERAVRKAEVPLTLDDLVRVLGAPARDRVNLRRAIDHLARLRHVAEGSKGVMWLSQRSGRMTEAIRKSRPL